MPEPGARGPGRPTLGPGYRRTTVFLTEEQIEYLKRIGGSASAGIRRLIEEGRLPVARVSPAQPLLNALRERVAQRKAASP